MNFRVAKTCYICRFRNELRCVKHPELNQVIEHKNNAHDFVCDDFKNKPTRKVTIK